MHPSQITDTRATVLNPARVNFHPVLMAEAWFAMMETRGHRITRDQMLRLQPAHLIETAAPQATPTPQPAFSEHIATVASRVVDYVAKRRANGTLPTRPHNGGDAA